MGRGELNKAPLAYLGVTAPTPPNMTVDTRAPTTKDYRSHSLADLWLNTSTNGLWILVAKTNGMGTWVMLGAGGGTLNTLTGNTGGAVSPDGGNNINVVGDGTTATVVGNPGTNTLTISASGSVPIQFDEDTGSASPSLGILNIVGADGIATSGAGNTVTIGTDGTLADTYTTDSGNATPSMGVIDILGGDNINTAGATNVVTVNLNDFITWPATNVGGTEGIIFLDSNPFLYSPRGTNTFTGENAGNLALTGDFNVAYGVSSLDDITSGDNNTALGTTVLGNLTSGSDNIAIGLSSGSAYTTESDNILINNSGTVADANTIRIGTEGSGSGQQDTVFIAGIYNTTGLASPRNVVVDSTGQLGYDSGSGPVTYTVQTTDATPTTIFNQTIAEGEAVDVSCLMIAAVTDYSEGLAGKLNGGARRETGMSTTVIGSPIVDYSEDITGSPTFTLTTSGNDVIIQVTGVAATTINWKAIVTVLLLDA